jgi:hypothetical protein
MNRRLFVVVAVLLVSGCSRSHYAYQIINDSPDALIEVHAADPNYAFANIDMMPFQGGVRVSLDGQPPREIEIRWTRTGHAPKSVRISTGFDCPGRPKGELSTLQYWIRADDSVQTRFEIETEPHRADVDFIPCETDADRTRRIANARLAQASTDGDRAGLDAALKDAQLNPTGYFDPAPLHLAVAAGHLPIVQELIRRGAHIEVPQRWAAPSALSLAIQDGHLEIAEFLIESGADLNRPMPKAPLLVAAEKGYIKLVERMLDRGANVALESFGQSAVINAAREGHATVVALLLQRGADPNTMVGGTSSSALDIAEQFDRQEAAAVLVRHGAKRGISIPPK